MASVLDLEDLDPTWHWWLMSVILATPEAEIRRIGIQNPPRQVVCETLS
jgi:hypothetical protein